MENSSPSPASPRSIGSTIMRRPMLTFCSIRCRSSIVGASARSTAFTLHSANTSLATAADDGVSDARVCTRGYSLGVLIETVYPDARVPPPPRHLPNDDVRARPGQPLLTRQCATLERPNFGVNSGSRSAAVTLWRQRPLVTFVSQSRAIPQALSSMLFHPRI